jgi:hypothetical protein
VKKGISLILVLCMLVSFAACGEDTNQTGTQPNQPTDAPNAVATMPGIVTEPTEYPARREQLDDLLSRADVLSEYDRLSRFSYSYFQDGELMFLEGMDGIRQIFETAQLLAPEFPEAQEVLNNFTLFEDKLLSMYPWYEDALGNIVDRNTTYFDYRTDGSLIDATNDTYELLAPPDDFAANYGITEYTYDENGKIATARYYTDETKEKIRCVMEYGYDENGFLITQHYLDADGKEFNIVYHNDENGLPIKADGYPYLRNFNPTPGTAYFTYDDQNRLTSITIESERFYNSFGRLTRDYVYDESGNLISIRRYHKDIYDNPNQGAGYQDVEVWNYFYDESGKCLYHTYTDYVVCHDDGTPAKEDVITYRVDYTYGTYYCYAPAE